MNTTSVVAQNPHVGVSVELHLECRPLHPTRVTNAPGKTICNRSVRTEPAFFKKFRGQRSAESVESPPFLVQVDLIAPHFGPSITGGPEIFLRPHRQHIIHAGRNFKLAGKHNQYSEHPLFCYL
ncbi:hypothetical protein TNCV_2411541 [Trichonephila clavipes]|nr:hypothetical protein TNCV_2411541 [Trichonephila clavipes]